MLRLSLTAHLREYTLALAAYAQVRLHALSDHKNLVSTDFPLRGVLFSLTFRYITQVVPYRVTNINRQSKKLFKKFSLKGCILYATHTPCTDCARAIIQSGIKTVVTNKIIIDENTPKGTWRDKLEFSAQMFKEAGVEYIELDPLEK